MVLISGLDKFESFRLGFFLTFAKDQFQLSGSFALEVLDGTIENLIRNHLKWCDECQDLIAKQEMEIQRALEKKPTDEEFGKTREIVKRIKERIEEDERMGTMIDGSKILAEEMKLAWEAKEEISHLSETLELFIKHLEALSKKVTETTED